MTEPSIDPIAAGALATAALALWLKGVLLSLAQVVVRVRTRTLPRPEDARLLRVPPADGEHLMVLRLEAAWRNELEAAPATLTIAAGYVLVGGAAPAFGYALFAFVLARWAQGLAMVLGRQPDRTLAWLGGLAASAYLAALLIASLLTA